MLKVASGLAGVGSLNYQGTWNASSNVPFLQSGVGTKGYYYLVSVAGSTNLDGITNWQVNDWAVFDGTRWEKVDNNNSVISVNGQTGVVVLTAANVGATPNTAYVVAGTGLSGGGALTGNVTLSVTANSVNQKVAVQNNGVAVGSEPAINFIPGTSVTITTADDSGNSRSNVTIGLSNNQITLGNTVMSLANTTSTVGNLTLNNVTINSVTVAINVANVTTTTAASATFATSSLPLVPAGYFSVNLNGTVVKVPYYAV